MPDVDQMLVAFAIMAPYMILPLEGGGRLVLTHGHHPVEEVYLQPGDVLVSGHTHVLKAEKAHINPGSISLPKEGNPKTYAVLEGRQVTIKTLRRCVCAGQAIKRRRTMAYSIEQDVDQILLSEQQIAQRVAELGAQITADYADRPLMLVGILKGAGIFHADLARAIKGRVQLDFMVASSYGSGAVSSGTLHIIKDLEGDVAGKDILLVEILSIPG